jgi:penicillin-binding protein 1A
MAQHEPGATAPAHVVLTGLPPRRPWTRSLLKWSLFASIGLANAGVIAFVGLYTYFSRNLPSIPSLSEYRPPIITEVVSADGQIVAEFFDERRKVVPYERIPRPLLQAFIAAEDQHFFEHHGIDLIGTARAAINTLLRHHVQGGSTLTQQTAKSLLISSEGFEAGTKRSFQRKMREFVLATRLERAFSKEEILWLYLNGVYLGHHSYGVQAAAENYYRKNVEDLTLPEAALIAGLAQAPSKYSPFAHPESARNRRRYVLRRMHEEGMITDDERESAEGEEVKVYPVDDIFRETAPFYVESVRRNVVEQFGNERMLRDGLRVEAAMELERQRAAQAAMLSGLMEVDHRQGYYGPVEHLEASAVAGMRAKLSRVWPRNSLKMGDYAVGIVTAIDEGRGEAHVQAGADVGVLPIAGLRWARKPNPEAYYPSSLISKISTALAVNDLVVVRRVESKELAERDPTWHPEKSGEPVPPILFSLEQDPHLQGALVSIDPWSGYVSAMVGGYDFDASEFNRAFQACRQPGSAFKPLVYSAAISKLDFSPATVLTDAPIVFRDDERAWKPKNYGEDFKGEVTVRTALVNSMNIPAVKTAEALWKKFGDHVLADWAKSLGVTSPVKLELGSALGSSCVTLWDLANVYALFDRYGEKRPSTLVKRVLDRDGRLLQDHSDLADPWLPLSSRLGSAYAAATAKREQPLDTQSAYITVHLMQEVATVGTGAQAAKLGKPAAGKTGTTNDSFDTWFMGFTRNLVTGVWLGYDQLETPLGVFETGGRAALPIWLSYMGRALNGRNEPNFPVPDGIVTVPIDPQTGKLATATGHGIPEPFKLGTEPTDTPSPTQPSVDNQELFNQ